MVKAVFLDLYNTVAGFFPPREQIQMTACKDFGIEVTPGGILKGYVDADEFMTQQNTRRHIQKLSQDEIKAFFTEYERLILKGAGVVVPGETAWKVWERVRQIPYDLALYDDSIPALKELKRRRLVLGLISNIYRDVNSLCVKLGIAPYLDFVMTSHEAGSEKPHAPIFLAALAKAKVKPSEAIHVGDQYNADVIGARGVGIKPVLIDREGLFTNYTDVPKVRTLLELPALLDR